MTHKQWLDNEYSQWAAALNECSVHNFKEHPMVRRMLSLDLETDLFDSCLIGERLATIDLLEDIDKIGSGKLDAGITDQCLRMFYYAKEIIKLNPPSICEIGGGVGQFYAILRAMGYKGTYWIFDIPEVITFQGKYLNEVTRRTGLPLHQTFCKFDTVISFYAIGEFDDETKQHYSPLISDCPHGYIAWNPHSGAKDDLSIFNGHDITVTPGIEPGIKIIQW